MIMNNNFSVTEDSSDKMISSYNNHMPKDREQI